MGTTGSTAFWEWLKSYKVKSGDALIFEALDAEARRYRVTVEHANALDPHILKERTEAIYQAMLEHVQKSRGSSVWDEARYLLARGNYKHPLPPESITPIWNRVLRKLNAPPPIECDIYQLRITLRDARPAIWRRVLVPADWNLGALHYVIQVAMGWTNSHLHQFKAGGKFISLYPIEELQTIRSAKVTLEKIAPEPKTRFVYEYDFGDSWEHDIVVEAITKPDPDVRYPACIDGKRACPPEDCGGVYGYDDLLAIIRDAEHPEHEDDDGLAGRDARAELRPGCIRYARGQSSAGDDSPERAGR